MTVKNFCPFQLSSGTKRRIHMAFARDGAPSIIFG
jgi:hypothetical protein